MHSFTINMKLSILLAITLLITTTFITAQLPFSFLEVCPHETKDNFIPILDTPCSQDFHISVAPLTRVNVTSLPIKGSCGESYYHVDAFGVSGYLSVKYACNAYDRIYRSGDVVKSCNNGGASLFSSAAVQVSQGLLSAGQVALVLSEPIYVSAKDDYSYRVLVDQKVYYVMRNQVCALSFAN
ncbi:predicted protein [Naegleria gruberi]|uniref:Predicted protein n=1 Tax=Naegleria gruberi TaxID=5762 RepID=D2V8V3_NAEGR|nr:uncharacterized protein NAEGRDRAFT_65294 [Naegleria gruberi]EFC46864.1 predicted protein [Naegleria gruberi]|eukprot:XP_002679608.1 predicted protein [Naegleria gruberi strain NEG-M]